MQGWLPSESSKLTKPRALSRTNSWALDQTSDTSSTRSQSSEFVIQKEDFPALSPFGNAPSSNDKASMQQPPDHGELKRHSSFHSSVNDSIMASHQTRPTGVAGSNSSIGSRGSGAPGFLPPSSSSVQSSGNASSSLSGTGAFGPLHGTRPGASTANGELDPSNQFGLLGMLHTVIRPSNDAKKNLLMGCDLTSLGLNLNSAELLYPVFASPWADGPLTKEPQFTLPMCYYNQPPALKTTHLAKFHLETLFYIFYSMPKDVLQAYAAQELYARDWRYHTDLKMWLKRATPADAALFANGSGAGGLLSPSAPSGSLGLGGAGGIGSIGSIGSASSASSSSAGLGSLGPQFLFFDTTTWERRVFTGNIHSLSAGLLSEEDIRVKFTASS
jgi:CCR4-NOT transcription complex subunit 2